MLSTFQCDDLRYGLTREPRLDSRPNLVAQRSDRIIGSIHVSPGHCKSAMPKKVAHEKSIRASLTSIGAESVPQIVQMDVVEFCHMSEPLPGLLDRGFGWWPLGVVARRKHPPRCRVQRGRQFTKHAPSRGADNNELWPAGLRLAQRDQAFGQVNAAPFEVEHLR